MQFLIAFPLIMSVIWLSGTIIYYFKKERNKQFIHFEKINEGISFIVSCYNEEQTIEATIESIARLSYPVKEIIIVNDGSTDRTAEKLSRLSEEFAFDYINLKKNQGKANALNIAYQKAQYEYIMCVDADTVIDDLAPYLMMSNFLTYQDIGAVTGNPRIRNKNTLLSRIQIVEFASIIGGIKRTQELNGYINTVSGVFTLFKKSALQEVGGWDIDMVTEDIALSWKLHLNNYRIMYEPKAICYMLVPETIRGLFKQRKRWAQGNQEVLLRDFLKMRKVRNIGLWILFIEQVLSIVWVFSMIFTLSYTLLTVNFLDYYLYAETLNIILVSVFLLMTVNILLFTVTLVIDSHYEKENIIYLLYLSWYPILYWLINALTIVAALPNALARKDGEYATWTSPDRGGVQ